MNLGNKFPPPLMCCRGSAMIAPSLLSKTNYDIQRDSVFSMEGSFGYAYDPAELLEF